MIQLASFRCQLYQAADVLYHPGLLRSPVRRRHSGGDGGDAVSGPDRPHDGAASEAARGCHSRISAPSRVSCSVASCWWASSRRFCTCCRTCRNTHTNVTGSNRDGIRSYQVGLNGRHLQSHGGDKRTASAVTRLGRRWVKQTAIDRLLTSSTSLTDITW